MAKPGKTRVKTKGIEEKRFSRRFAKATKRSGVFYGYKRSGFVSKGTEKTAAVYLDNIQERSRCTEMLETRKTNHPHSTLNR